MKYSLAISVLTKGRYVDDGFGGADSIREAQDTVKQVVSICKAGGFPLHKWAANNSEILRLIPPDEKAISSPVRIDEKINGARFRIMLESSY